MQRQLKRFLCYMDATTRSCLLQGCNAVPWQSAFAVLACEILTRVLGQNRVDEAGVGEDDKISEEHLERR
jgi:hypothetical protein